MHVDLDGCAGRALFVLPWRIPRHRMAALLVGLECHLSHLQPAVEQKERLVQTGLSRVDLLAAFGAGGSTGTVQEMVDQAAEAMIGFCPAAHHQHG